MNCGDTVKFVSVPSNVPLAWVSNKTIGVGVLGKIVGRQNGYAEVLLDGGHKAQVPIECLSLVGPDKVIPGSTVQVYSVQNISVNVLGEGRTINVSAGQVIDWFDENGEHAALSDVSRLMGVRLRQALRKLVDAEKLLSCPTKDEPDHAHLRYIEVSSRITNGVLSIVDDIENTVSDAVF
ncbi:hypothetical protein UFOVP1229_125 [uncultured Caudovirales phage]|uniref:Uncharacterized protein n=1 Tax=uncultured Caudovirales phage TaxID=2100421 RepID=A0A6J5RDJ7_9CAUD|nr:hypothetical protein UFOVP1229_125 [uncultured Caudovirales phage]